MIVWKVLRTGKGFVTRNINPLIESLLNQEAAGEFLPFKCAMHKNDFIMKLPGRL